MKTDLSDDEIMQAVAIAINAYRDRFGEPMTVDMLQDLLDTIEENSAE